MLDFDLSDSEPKTLTSILKKVPFFSKYTKFETLFTSLAGQWPMLKKIPFYCEILVGDD